MAYYVRMMHHEDIRQVTDIDREAFPTMFPPTNLHHELQNRLAHYMVAVDTEKMVDPPEVTPDARLSKIAGRVVRFFNHNHYPDDESQLSRDYIVGFVGMWILVDEAHITSIAVRETYRGKGIGEMLLVSITDLATQLKAHLLTLEVRVSNTIAQNLYHKYGFTKVGIRRGYYTDNFEDGLLMSIPDIQSSAFQEQFQKLKETHFKKLGTPSYPAAR